MKAAVGHAQRYRNSRFIGMTEPSIIAAEPPQPAGQRAGDHAGHRKTPEAFVRIAHGIIIFPAASARRELYLLGIP